VLALIIGGALLGALINLVQCLLFAAIAAVGAIVAIRVLALRQPPASKQIIDQPRPDDDGDRVAEQIQERRERLRRG
jgi:hypothetical protein